MLSLDYVEIRALIAAERRLKVRPIPDRDYCRWI
jgi:hypothetical protein